MWAETEGWSQRIHNRGIVVNQDSPDTNRTVNRTSISEWCLLSIRILFIISDYKSHIFDSNCLWILCYRRILAVSPSRQTLRSSGGSNRLHFEHMAQSLQYHSPSGTLNYEYNIGTGMMIESLKRGIWRSYIGRTLLDLTVRRYFAIDSTYVFDWGDGAPLVERSITSITQQHWRFLLSWITYNAKLIHCTKPGISDCQAIVQWRIATPAIDISQEEQAKVEK